MSFTDPQVRSIILSLKAQLDALGASNIGTRGRAAIFALDAIGEPTAAPVDPGSPPPTTPPPSTDPTGCKDSVRRFAYAPEFGATCALVADLGNGKITYRQVP